MPSHRTPINLLRIYHYFCILFRYGHMIDNVVLIVTGTLHEREVQELLVKCHPLGMFDSIATLAVAQNMRELYRLVLVDTPLAPYFSDIGTELTRDDRRKLYSNFGLLYPYGLEELAISEDMDQVSCGGYKTYRSKRVLLLLDNIGSLLLVVDDIVPILKGF
ncbi:unnamed protein product [Fraxinus pennsylvanica]|uniref:Uncharacterized protein n=1 Tax=Fraxinus pennsylvanica TaxID=56036 RepID=A0AAD2E7B8_9LAMI|nr:unnamed protein product [Fraxinus pennsylvanica]